MERIVELNTSDWEIIKVLVTQNINMLNIAYKKQTDAIAKKMISTAIEDNKKILAELDEQI